jgi:hypothetical protein
MEKQTNELPKLTAKLPSITSRENNARIVGIAVSTISGGCIRNDTACDAKAAMVIEFDLRFVGHGGQSSRKCKGCALVHTLSRD